MRPSSPASDIYSLTCVLYEALTGDLPFPADSYEHLIAAHISSPPPRPSTVNARVPAALDDVIARGMAKEPDDRYGSAAALSRAAQRALQASGQVPAPDANTMAAPYVSTPSFSPTSSAEKAGQTTGPTVTLDQHAGHSRQWLVPMAVIGVAAALLLGAYGCRHRTARFKEHVAGPTPLTDRHGCAGADHLPNRDGTAPVADRHGHGRPADNFNTLAPCPTSCTTTARSRVLKCSAAAPNRQR